MVARRKGGGGPQPGSGPKTSLGTKLTRVRAHEIDSGSPAPSAWRHLAISSAAGDRRSQAAVDALL